VSLDLVFIDHQKGLSIHFDLLFRRLIFGQQFDFLYSLH
jgi:predicted O-methyltransferase YrrM